MINFKPKFYYKGTPVQVEDTFRMGGVLVASVEAEEPIFRTDPRPNAPCKATRLGWVKATELTVQLPLPTESVTQERMAQ